MKIEVDEKEYNDMKQMYEFYRKSWHESVKNSLELWERLGLMAIKTPEFQEWFKSILEEQKTHGLLKKCPEIKPTEVVGFFLHGKTIGDALHSLSSWDGH